MKKIICILSGIFLLSSCTKSPLSELEIEKTPTQQEGIKSADESTVTALKPPSAITIPQFVLYTIPAGQHSSDKSVIKSVKVTTMNFVAKFDNSAIYQSVIPENQYDINKLYGFSEGFNHQYNSARIGWAFNDGSLRLYAYAYNKGVRESQEITPVSIGTEVSCSISVSSYLYTFTVNNVSLTLPRANSTSSASGYQLYPYFGGDEVAPQNIYISIKQL